MSHTNKEIDIPLNLFMLSQLHQVLSEYPMLYNCINSSEKRDMLEKYIQRFQEINQSHTPTPNNYNEYFDDLATFLAAIDYQFLDECTFWIVRTYEKVKK